ncbi:hypothetical protein COU78_04475 [Candidatus Peregrinibacteria bacterium CG10_big_fil_rev_8_21_14_0_10_49_24]|nr:MAG: hypothetical protein COV83_01890 [Candidatus Peregrinibacteria bacterium CG11_big_fil_rev_8_21_14_0_20_49_14]PIR50826.1 MAG: hypothetical protein COU78_04475 [Candidatus Peregrinibacteria bacterium CG10_big_fil_rev_8_21_14_0_10_49_24]
MHKYQISVAAIAVILMGVLGWQAVKSPNVVQEDVLLENVTAEISLNARTLFPEEILASQHQKVTVHILSDESGEFHIAGYERVFPLEKDTLSTFVFQAYRQGRFSLEFHPIGSETEHMHDHEENTANHAHEDIHIGTLVVVPR